MYFETKAKLYKTKFDFKELWYIIAIICFLVAIVLLIFSSWHYAIILLFPLYINISKLVNEIKGKNRMTDVIVNIQVQDNGFKFIFDNRNIVYILFSKIQVILFANGKMTIKIDQKKDLVLLFEETNEYMNIYNFMLNVAQTNNLSLQSDI